jgi:hypothetical protein
MRPPRILLAVAGLIAGAAGLQATTVVPPEFPELVQSSDYVIRGRVKALRNEIQLRDGREVPFTLVEIEVKQVIAGEPPANVVLRLLGGRTSDGGSLTVEGVPQFQAGDEDILFVRGNGTTFYPLAGVMHGRYPVRFDKNLRREYVARANGVPLAATAEVALPLAEGKLAQFLRQQRRAEDALTPSEFAQSIREARVARTQGGVSREK